MNLSVRGTMTTGQAAAIRGGTSAVGTQKKSGGGVFKSILKGVAQVGLGVAGAVIPGGGILANALGGAFGNSVSGAGGFGSSAGMSAGGNSMVSEMAQMNMQFMALQNAVQNESRKFQTVSNASRSRHDIAMNAVRNMKA